MCIRDRCLDSPATEAPPFFRALQSQVRFEQRRAGAGAVPAGGGAMDLAGGARLVFVMTDHNTKNGDAKIVRECTYPLTGPGVVNTIYSDIAVIDFTPDGLVVREKVAGISFDDLQARTEARIGGQASCGELSAPEIK